MLCDRQSTLPPRDFHCDDSWRSTPYVCIKCKKPLTVVRNTPWEKPYHGICEEGHCHWAFAGDCIRSDTATNNTRRKKYSLDSATLHSTGGVVDCAVEEDGPSVDATVRWFLRFFRS